GRETREHPDVLETETGCAAVRILERHAPGRKPGPARRVVRMAGEAGPQVGGQLGHLLLRDAEGGGERLARDVVGCPAEAAGDDQVVDAAPLTPDEVAYRNRFVRYGGRDHDLDAERLEPLGEPGGVRVRDVAGDDLVA